MVVKPKHVGAFFKVNFNVSFNIFLEQSSSAFSWINKRRDNILHTFLLASVEVRLHRIKPVLQTERQRQGQRTVFHLTTLSTAKFI